MHAGLFRKLLADRYEKFAACLKQELLEVLDETVKPIARAAKAHRVWILYLPGNGEITPDDFLTADIRRAESLRNLLQRLKLTDEVKIYFGHIHLDSNDSRMALYPSTMGFMIAGHQCTWVKPGIVLKI